jgi:hypothetical protein
MDSALIAKILGACVWARVLLINALGSLDIIAGILSGTHCCSLSMINISKLTLSRDLDRSTLHYVSDQVGSCRTQRSGKLIEDI